MDTRNGVKFWTTWVSTLIYTASSTSRIFELENLFASLQNAAYAPNIESLPTDYYKALLELLLYQNSIQNCLELRTDQLLLRMTYVLLRIETFANDPVDPPPSHLYTLPQGGGKNLENPMRKVTSTTVCDA